VDYLYPYYLKQFSNQNIVSVACDISLIGLSDTRKVLLWGGLGVQAESDDVILSSNFSLKLEETGIETIMSTGSELAAISKSGICYLNTSLGAPVVFMSPHKLVAFQARRQR
jgi:hypothetical protein